MISSYTPTVSSLLSARKAYAPVKIQDVKALIAAVPRSFSPLWPELASTIEEVNAVKAAFPESALISIPGTSNSANGKSGGVTAGTLLGKLPETTILHLHQEKPDLLKSNTSILTRDFYDKI
jgi:hypothetical protein